jgi:hypothetical protein
LKRVDVAGLNAAVGSIHVVGGDAGGAIGPISHRRTACAWPAAVVAMPMALGGPRTESETRFAPRIQPWKVRDEARRSTAARSTTHWRGSSEAEVRARARAPLRRRRTRNAGPISRSYRAVPPSSRGGARSEIDRDQQSTPSGRALPHRTGSGGAPAISQDVPLALPGNRPITC